MKALVTGGAGFIGSHLVDQMMENGEKVTVFDDMSAGSMSNLGRWNDSPNIKIIKESLLDPVKVLEAVEGIDVVYHLAANPEVRTSKAGPEDHYKQNVQATYNLLEAIRKRGDINCLAFTSTSTVYGEPNEIPTPETYAPLKPISHYGASKLAAEALMCSYAHMYGFRCVIFRMANVVGPRSNHGVTYDFVNKLKKDPTVLEILGDGTQTKSYLYVNDCVEGMLLGVEKSYYDVEIMNIGSEDRINVLRIGQIVIEEMGLDDVEISLTGGVDGGRGWKGDVKIMQLDMSRLKSLGWRPQKNSSEAIRLTARSIIKSDN